MSDPDLPPTGTRRHPWLRALGRPLLFVAATIYFLIDDVVLAVVRPIVARLAEMRIFARLAEALHRLPPYPTLVLFLVPFVVLEPFKLWGLWLLGTGHFGSGAAMLAVSHLTSIVLVERLFHATRDKLLTIGWFARTYAWVMALYDWSLGRLRATVAWRVASATLVRLRESLRRVVVPLRRALRSLFAPVRSLLTDLRGRWRRSSEP